MTTFCSLRPRCTLQKPFLCLSGAMAGHFLSSKLYILFFSSFHRTFYITLYLSKFYTSIILNRNNFKSVNDQVTKNNKKIVSMSVFITLYIVFVSIICPTNLTNLYL